ncbi:MAG: anhydro-N-acetylmuramic acid kinase [Cyanobacteria bacterium P01_H01_bin.15]
MPNIIGLMSGTSVDGIDAALVEISGSDPLQIQVQLLANRTVAYPNALREQILSVCAGAPLSMPEWAALDDAIATAFAEAALAIAEGWTVDLIGSHGQTIFHRPPAEKLGYSCQLGRGDLIFALTDLPVVSNFRAADIAWGGQGAPLVSKVDAVLLGHAQETRCIQNIGGIGNVTYLPPTLSNHWETKILGFDTGPGNALLDLAVERLTEGTETYDQNGRWAAQGTPDSLLISQWLGHSYFQSPPPKSTGRELFSPTYLDLCWRSAQARGLGPADWLATLTDFTAASIAKSYREFLPQLPNRVLVCGGGSRNPTLCKRLADYLPDARVETTAAHGIDPEAKEAIAFAVLAYWRYFEAIPGNLPAVTGASKASLLGDVCPLL